MNTATRTATTQAQAPRRLDLRGMANPEPVIVLAEWAAQLAPGEQLVAVTDDPCAAIDFLRWRDGSDIHLIEVRDQADGARAYVFRRRNPEITRRRPGRPRHRAAA